jgi:tetrapyrrole methylase family protein/MazG family protein
VYSREIAADLKLSLMMVYPDDHAVTLVQAAGTLDGAVRTLPLYDLDRDAHIDHLTSLWVPPLAQPGGLVSFEELVAHLRAPDGCPWDREQTHASLRPFLLQEAYEVLETLDLEDTDALKEELGDLLLQIVLHTQIATEDQEFKMSDVVGNIISKLKRRHPHVFGEVEVSGAGEVLSNWERIKSEEKRKAGESAGLKSERTSVLSGVPQSLPALARGQELLDRLARSGLENPDKGAAMLGAKAAWDELEAGYDAGAQVPLGKLLLALIDLARCQKVDAESALRAAIQRFELGIGRLEVRLVREGKTLHDLSPTERSLYWQEAQKEAADPLHQE